METSNSVWDRLKSDQVLKSLAAADQLRFSAFDQHFGRPGLTVVVTRHHETVRAGILKDHVVADLHDGQTPAVNESAFPLSKDIAGLAKRPSNDDVDFFSL